MDYAEFDIADFLADEYFVESVLHPTTESETYWQQWLVNHPEKHQLLKEARLMVLLSETDQTTIGHDEKEKLWLSIDQRTTVVSNLSIERNDLIPKRKKLQLRWYHVAAAIVLLVACSAIVFQITTSSSEMIVVENTSGKKSEFTLSDGTKVWLNATSKLVYPASFEAKCERHVVLTGEAFFDVVENPKQPFIVEAEKLQIKVLGTAFNVKCYDDENTIETTLVRGKVMIEPMEESEKLKSIMMKPDDQVIYSKSAKKISIEHVKTEAYTAWTTGKLVFNDETFASIKTKLERWYGVEIEVEDNAALNCRFSTTIQNEPITKILELFKSTGNITYEIRPDQHKLIIKGNLCKV